MDLNVLQKEILGIPGSADSGIAIRMSNIRIDSEVAIPKSVDEEQTFKKPSEKMTRLQDERVRKKEDVRARIYRESKGERLQQEERMKAEADWRRDVEAWDQAKKEWEATSTGSNAGASSWDEYRLKRDCIAPLRSRSLATVQIIKDINQVTYPAGIKGPDKELNTYAKDSKFVYVIEILRSQSYTVLNH